MEECPEGEAVPLRFLQNHCKRSCAMKLIQYALRSRSVVKVGEPLEGN